MFELTTEKAFGHLSESRETTSRIAEDTSTQTGTDMGMYFPYGKDDVMSITDELTELFLSLPSVPSIDGLIDMYRGLPGRERILRSDLSSKYIYWADRLGYRMMRPSDALRCGSLPGTFKKFVSQEDCVVVMPSWDKVSGKVIGVTVRSLFSKGFRRFTPMPYVPHGFLMSEKTYYEAWIVVESAFDADWIRTLYPHVIASGGISGLNTDALSLVCGTSPLCIVAFDNDDSGDTGYKNIIDKTRFLDAAPTIRRMRSPYGKDFGDVAELAMSDKRLYEVYRNLVLNSIRTALM